ncbi:MAG TPA: hypothetical protein VG294_06515 [Solirubrobacteraceae bacterium]|nr:hypothetical protein [Solirubrobacteraceae bacterium]
MWAVSRRTGLFVVSYVPLAAMFVVLKWPHGWNAGPLIRLGVATLAAAALVLLLAGLKKADFVNRQGEIQCDDERVVELLDALEGRYFDDGFTDEHRRADRFRPRR